MENTVVEERRTITKVPVTVDTVEVEETTTVETEVTQVPSPVETVVTSETETTVSEIRPPTQQVSWEVKPAPTVVVERLKRSTGPDVVVRVQ